MSVEVPEFTVNESVVFAEHDDEAVLLNVESGVYFGLDEIGTVIWNLLSSGATEEDIVQRLFELYEAELSQLRADVRQFFITLQDRGLVRAAGA